MGVACVTEQGGDGHGGWGQGGVEGWKLINEDVKS